MFLQKPLLQDSMTTQADNVTWTKPLSPSNPARGATKGSTDSKPFTTAGELPNAQARISTSWPQERLAKFLQSYAEPSSVQVKAIGGHTTRMMSLCYWFGPIVMKQWTQNGEEIFKVRPAGSAYGCGLTIRFPWYYLGRLDFVLFGFNEASTARTLSLRWSLSFPRVVSFDAHVMSYARNGDLNAIKKLFHEGKATCTDITPDGTSLLHVSHLLEFRYGD